MIITILVIGFIIIGVLVALIIMQGGKGRTIYVERFEQKNGTLVSLDPKKPIKAKQYRNENGIEILRLPKKYSKEAIEGVSPEHENLTSTGISKVRLLKVAEEIYVPLMASKVKNKFIYTDLIINRDAAAFYIDEIKRNAERYKNQSSFWERYGGLIGVAFVGVILLIAIIFITRFATEQMDAARAVESQSVDKILNTLKGFTGVTQATAQVETDTARPIGNEIDTGGE
jgi:hypothetical protein